jgi:hypothetical protein
MNAAQDARATARRAAISIRKQKKGKRAPAPKYDSPDGPAIVTALHSKDRELSHVAGSEPGYRRCSWLDYLATHGPARSRLSQEQVAAGNRYSKDFEMSKMESAARMNAGGAGGGSAKSTLSDAALDAGTRFQDARAKLPAEYHQLLDLFLCPEHHPFSVERCAAIVNIDRRAAADRIRVGLSILARHYGLIVVGAGAKSRAWRA